MKNHYFFLKLEKKKENKWELRKNEENNKIKKER